MVIDIKIAITNTLLSGAMMIGYSTGVGDFIGCNVYVFMLYPISVIFFTFLVMSIDKVIALTLPLRHRAIMKRQVVGRVIIAKHILAIIISVNNLFPPGSYTEIAQFGTCIKTDSTLHVTLITKTMPMLLACLITISLDITSPSKPIKFVKRCKKRASYQEVTVGIMINLKQ